MTVGTLRELPPRGHYLAHEVGWLAGVSGKTIGQWARRGYIRSSRSSLLPLVYSYQDVGEAMVVHELLDHNVSHAAIRKTIEHLRSKYGSAWPLTHAELSVVPVHPDAVGRSRTVVEADAYDIPGRHPVLAGVNLESIRADLHRGGWAARALPDLRFIEVDPDRLSGRPVIRGRRVPAEDAARLADAKGGRAALREGYGLSDPEIDDAVRWWQKVQEFERLAS